MRALITAMVSCRLRTSANVFCSWAARCCICRSSARRQRLNARANTQNAPSNSTARPTIITVSNDGLGRISNIAAPVTAVTLRQTTDATTTACTGESKFGAGREIQGKLSSAAFLNRAAVCSFPCFFLPAPSSEPCFGGEEELPRRAQQERLPRAVRVGLDEAVRVDGAEVFLVREVGRVQLDRQLLDRPEAAEAIARREVHQRVRIHAALVQVRVEALVGVVQVRAREERAIVVRQLGLEQ